MNADGSDVTQLTDNEMFNDKAPRWSPDGRRIAFRSVYHFRNSVNPKNYEIYVMNADGSDVTQLTDNEAEEDHQSWSPDGRRILFHSYRDRNWEIYMMNADGSDVTRLTDNNAWDWYASWSPDGRRIAFTSNRDRNMMGIYMMNADGSDVTRLTDNEVINPRWSPDGRHIAFTSWGNENSEIYVMDADGSGVTRLAYGGGPSWSPGPTSISATAVAPTPAPMPDQPPFRLEWQASASDIEAGESFTLTVRMYDVQEAESTAAYRYRSRR